jgi:hypothetical protein
MGRQVEKLKNPELDKYIAKIVRDCPDEFKSDAGGQVQKNKKGQITR